MDKTNQTRQSPYQDPKLQNATGPGGYHSRGVPGEEGEVRRRMRILKNTGNSSHLIYKSRPLSGGTSAGQASSSQLDKTVREARWEAGARLATSVNDQAKAIFVIASKGMEFLDTPVFHAGENDDEESVALFTSRERAQHYLGSAGWDKTDEVGELSPDDLLEWLTDAHRKGIRYVTIDPDRVRHLAGEPQDVIVLDTLGEESADSLYQRIAQLVQG